MSTDTPEERARQALIAMLDAGQSPTARAVRQRSGVAMQIAADTVAAWKRERDGEAQAPPVPADVMTRLTAVWADAYAAADAIHRPAREAADQQVAQLSEERDGLLSDVSDLETQVEKRDHDLEDLHAQLAEARSENGVLQARLDEVRGRATELETRTSDQDQTIGQLRGQLEDLRRQAAERDTEKASGTRAATSQEPDKDQ